MHVYTFTRLIITLKVNVYILYPIIDTIKSLFILKFFHSWLRREKENTRISDDHLPDANLVLERIDGWTVRKEVSVSFFIFVASPTS